MLTAAPDLHDQDIFPALLSYVRQRKCALFVGAGLSRAAGYPDWAELMRLIVKETGRRTKTDPKELKTLLKARKFTDVADQCRELLGRTRFSELLRHELAQELPPPEATHRAIVRTPYACIVTTNFDTLLEDAYRRWSNAGVPKAPTGVGLGSHGTLLLDGAFFILKAHGTIHDDASMVFTTEDYRQIIHQNPAFTAMMSAILLSHAVLFVGYSLGDPNFRLLLDSQLTSFGTQAPPRYAFMEAVGDNEREILRRTAGIEVLSYPKGQHGEVARLLRSIAEQTSLSAAPSRPDRDVQRESGHLPTLRVTIRPHGAQLDLSWFETTSDNLGGAGVPLDRRYAATGRSLPWLKLARLLEEFHVGHLDRAYDSVVHLGSLLQESVGALSEFLADVPPEKSVVLDLAPELGAVPWEWLTVSGRPLSMRNPVCRTASVLDDASRGRPFLRTPARILLIGDTTGDWAEGQLGPLPGARNEVRAIAREFGGSSTGNVTVLLGKDATYQRVLQELAGGEYDIVHFAGHAWYDSAGTYLIVNDGVVRASELMTLLIRHPPVLLFINSHFTAFVPAFTKAFPLSLPDGSSFDNFYRRMRRRRPGLEHAVARAGVGTFIGCMGEPGDDGAAAFAARFYAHLRSGKFVAEALRRAREQASVGQDATPMLYAAAGYLDLRFPGTR